MLKFAKRCFMNHKKTKLSKEELQRRKEENLKEFGTDNRDEIRQMFRKFDIRYSQLRCLYIGIYCKKNGRTFNRVTYHQLSHIIRNDIRIVTRQRNALFGLEKSKELAPAEKFLIKLDDIILENQLSQKKYKSEDIDVIIDNIRKKYSTVAYRLQSVDINDYDIDKDLNVTLHKSKERYKNLPDSVKEQEVKVFDRFEL